MDPIRSSTPTGTYYAFLGDGMIHGFFLAPNKDRGRVRFFERP
jgi:carotenoid cleavage dioxygenase-like enzyme